MRASLKWLRRSADLAGDAQTIADRLTMAGYVVASVEPCGDDVVFDVEVTYNRPDLLSHAGLRRELGSVLGVDVRTEPTTLPAGVAIKDTLPAVVTAADLCPLYTARVVRGVRVGPSPPWMVADLASAGQRSVNCVVDVTNWVMLETGQPLHAFDLARLAGPGIVVRRAKGESMVAIDGSSIQFGDDELAICDQSSPAALAGVMGGRGTEVTESTIDIVIESAVFTPLSIRSTARRHQMRSESSFRFERFVDRTGVAAASDLAARLMVEVCGAKGVGPIVVAKTVGEQATSEVAAAIALRTSKVEAVLGLSVGLPEIRKLLSSLGVSEVVAPPGGGVSGVTMWLPPSWRRDLVAEIDLIEEVGRLIGFDRVPLDRTLPTRPRVVNPSQRAHRRIRDALIGAGLRECVNAPFVGEGAHDVALLTAAAPLCVENPMRSEEGRLRRSLVGPLLQTARRNHDRGTATVRLFETAPVYVAGAAPSETTEMWLVAGVLSGTYADAKGAVAAVLTALGIDSVTYDRGAPSPLRADRSATLRVQGEVIGVVGEIRARAADAVGVPASTAIFELRADRLVALAVLDRPYVPISRFPAVERDLAWVVEESVAWAAIERAARVASPDLVRAVTLQSIFRSAQVGGGRKSVAFRLELRARDRTLSGQEADHAVASVIAELAARTGGALRG